MADPPTSLPSGLAHSIVKRIKDEIIEGVFEPGARLKTEKLAERYKVSANPVREALQHLQGEGYVVLAPNQGARVRVVDDDFVRNIFEIRSVIEPIFARRFCAWHTVEALERLVAASDAFAAVATTSADAAELDHLNTAFHGILIEQETNLEALLVMERYAGLINAVRARLATTVSRAKARAREHQAIIDAIRDGDADRAAEASTTHVKAAGEDFLEQMHRARTAAKR